MTKVLTEILRHYTGRRRDALLPLLWDVQTALGCVDHAAVHAIAHTLRVPEADIYGVIGFYALFSCQPDGETAIHICTDPACGVAGADAALTAVCQHLNVQPDDTTPDGKVSVHKSPCLGLCEHAPAALIVQRGKGLVSHAPITDPLALLDGAKLYPGVLGGDPRVLLHGVDGTQRQTLAEYGDYAALRHALHDLTPEQVSSVVEASGLLGRGGAAFPTGMKWRFTRGAAAQPHYMVCNADESEPGTFKDRVLMEHRPHLLLEGLALAAYAVGASQCYLFLRGEYPLSQAALLDAIAEAEAAGLLGDQVLGTDFTCHVELRLGAGAYICGEETALFEAIEGKRGFPRVKPPYPTTHGLFNKPTAVNNVETLCAVPGIVLNGAAWYRQWGTDASTGTKLVSVSGHANRPGVYEVPFGVTLREVLETHCQGVQGDLQAVLMGGAAGTFLCADEVDVRLTYEDLRAAGSTLGSGAIMVFNDTVDLRDVLRRLGHFFAHESCGKCFPCQLGTQRQVEILDRLDAPQPGDYARLHDVGQTMTESSLCGLGQTAALAVLSALERWPDLFAE